MRGEVQHPGPFGIRPGERVSSLLERAGGFSSQAYPYGAVLMRPEVRELEMNARADEPVEAVVVRSGQEPIVVNLDIASAEPAPPAGGDPFHSNGA